MTALALLGVVLGFLGAWLLAQVALTSGLWLSVTGGLTCVLAGIALVVNSGGGAGTAAVGPTGDARSCASRHPSQPQPSGR